MHSPIRLQRQHAGLLFDTLWRSPMIMMMVICPFLRPLHLFCCHPSEGLWSSPAKRSPRDCLRLPNPWRGGETFWSAFPSIPKKETVKGFSVSADCYSFLFVCLNPMSTLQLKKVSIVRLTTQPWSHALSGCVTPRFYSHTARYDNGDDDSRQIVGWLSCFLFSPVSLVGLK